MKYLIELLDDLKYEVTTGYKVIMWYTAESFVYRMLNNTIR